MAWIEKRRQQYRVYERTVTGPKVHEASASALPRTDSGI